MEAEANSFAGAFLAPGTDLRPYFHGRRIDLALLAGDDDRYTVPTGEAKGMRGYFTRDEAGQVSGINLSGRHMTKTS